MNNTPSSDSARLDAILDRVHSFVDAELVPLEGLLLAGDFDALIPAMEEKRAQVRDLGLWNPHLSSDHGGLGLGLDGFGRVSEALGRSPLGHYAFNCQAPDAGNMELLLTHADGRQRGLFLEPLLRGDVRSCFGMTEPEHAGSNPTVMSTTARREGDDWVLDGHKWFTTAFDGAAFCIVMAVTDPDAENRYARASMVIVPTDADGVQHVRKLPVMGAEGAGWFSHSEIRLTGVRVPAENLLGPRGGGFLLAQERLGPGRIHHCMRWLGICERAFDLMCDYAGSRELAPGRSLATREMVQTWIAESRAEIDAARLYVLDTARRIAEADSIVEGQKAARVQVSAIKFFVAGVLQRVLDRALQTHGGLGMLDDTPIAFWARHERAARIYDGPDEVHKSVVAREELKARGYSIKR
ncbi:acyl-CoA dehydrogenase family protein [Rubrivirga marina]|uniref:Acyl-CoA dehydrogenase n=1 Tax=Rubrivirga marina TaxID=1196024 RepID=A0A271IUQ4_9BACT|nr:acyl-CoA dehydrogenase family protein [Rubrivirga marina]PAP74981.1 acyl-CoA dehydrogenase [Rubrivirga marina]